METIIGIFIAAAALGIILLPVQLICEFIDWRDRKRQAVEKAEFLRNLKPGQLNPYEPFKRGYKSEIYRDYYPK